MGKKKERKQEEERLLHRQGGEKGASRAKKGVAKKKVGDSGSRGTKTQTKIKDHEIKKVRKGRKGKERKGGGVLWGRGGV